MPEIGRTALFGKLNALGYKALEAATVFCKLRTNPYVELVHWIHQIFQLPDSDMLRIIRHFEIDSDRMAKEITEALDRLPRGATSISNLAIHVEHATERGWVYASLMFGLPVVRTGTLLIGILKTPTLKNTLGAISRELFAINADVLADDFWSITKGSPEDGLSAQDGTTIGAASITSQRDIFICYRRQDSVHATGRIFDRLTATFGKERVFKDVNSIPAGVKDFAEEIQQQLKSARVMLAVVGDSWLTASNTTTGKRRLDEKDDFVRIELKWGLDNKDVAVIPVLLDDTPMPPPRSLPAALKRFSRCQAITVRADPEFERDVQNLIAEVKASLSRAARPVT